MSTTTISRTGKAPQFGPYRVGPINFGSLIDRFFPDIDSLHDPEMLNVAGEQRREFMMTDQAFDTIAGLPPHPDEPVLSKYADEEGWLRQQDEYPASGRVPEYPQPTPDDAGDAAP
ncbi:MAG TPA: hypothetical protein VLA89_19305 [Gemmatimonadales bacterium]|nr:hypothetical protein [Gemmatimonadales bacterium]